MWGKIWLIYYSNVNSDIEQIKMLLLMFSLKSYIGSWVWPMLCKQEDSQDQYRKLNMVTWMTTTIVLWRNGGERTSLFASAQWEAISRDGAGHQMPAPDLCLQGYVHVDTFTQIAHKHLYILRKFYRLEAKKMGNTTLCPHVPSHKILLWKGGWLLRKLKFGKAAFKHLWARVETEVLGSLFFFSFSSFLSKFGSRKEEQRANSFFKNSYSFFVFEDSILFRPLQCSMSLSGNQKG